jgi:exosortase D (VPLPA-CTERM-specific)
MTYISLRPKAAERAGTVQTDIIFVIVVILAVVTFSGPLLELVHRWVRQEEYSHGFFMPIVTAWLLWTRRNALGARIGQPSWIGPALILLAIAMRFVAELSAIFVLSQVGFVVALFGIALGVGGTTLFKAIWFPIAFLLFAIPLPYFIDAALSLRLQLISSELGTWLIRAFGIPVYLDGNIIDMGTYKLQVVEACSGLRYLYPLVSLSCLAAYLFHAPIWQRTIVFVSAIPIAIGMNGLRIGLVGILVDRWGAHMADDALHLFEGWLIFIACAALLLSEMYILSLASGKPLFSSLYFPTKFFKYPSAFKAGVVARGPLVTCLVLLILGGISVYFASGRVEARQERSRFAEFPTRLSQWRGHPSLLDIETEKSLGLDDYILSDYSRSDGQTVNLYVAYYATQRTGESPHSPTVCIPSGGWAITKLQEIKYANRGEQQPLNRVIIEKGAAKEVVYYWFEERGRKLASELWAKVYLLTDAVLNNRTDGALVRLTTQVRPDESDADADQRLQAFMQVALPPLSTFLPSSSGAVGKSSILLTSTRGFQSKVAP